MKISLFPKNDILVLIFVLFLASNIRAQTPMVFVEGGTLPSGSLLDAQSVGFLKFHNTKSLGGSGKMLGTGL